MSLHLLAGHIAPPSSLVDIPALVSAYYTLHPDPTYAEQRISFGTSGHRGSSYRRSFNENHLLAIAQAVCLYRNQAGIKGPLFLGRDTHALSYPAWGSIVEVLVANGVEVMYAGMEGDEAYTPTPAISHAILAYRRRFGPQADGLIITPSHNPPDQGGCKYNPPHGGPAEKPVTEWIETCANRLLEEGLTSIKRLPLEQAMKSPLMRLYDYCGTYIDDLTSVLDMDQMRLARLHIGVDPLGGAGIAYWRRLARQYDLDITLMHDTVDPTFRFMSLDADGQIRMDPSSPYAMQETLKKCKEFDLLLVCDPDHDRHGIITPEGLIPPNHYLAVALDYLLEHRPNWNAKTQVGKTFVTSTMIDHVAKAHDRAVYEVPVGFKWFVSGLLDAQLSFVGEESAGATFLRHDGTVWTTEKDGIVMCLLAIEMQAKMGMGPATLYKNATVRFGNPAYARREFSATNAQKQRLTELRENEVTLKTLADEPIEEVSTHASGNHAALGGIFMRSAHSWCAVRPSGTEALYKVYAETFLGEKALEDIFAQLTAWILTFV